MESNLDTLDLSGKKLKKLSKPEPQEAQVSVLILDDNEFQRLDNIDSFSKVQKLSIVRNQLLRMYGVCRLHHLHTLNLAHNGILTVEGVKELVNLRFLCLTGNNIKTIEHLNTNVNLEHLDLSENSISHISDLSFLKNLKELYLHGNRIGHLRQCERYLPASLTTLTLASNNISDLNEMSQLVQLTNLTNFSITNNPCVNMSGNNVGFDYRPFIINWCMNVKVIDGYVVDDIERLRAEWLYSQGRGRHFRIGDHKELTQYLATVCPLSGETLETEEDRKLRLILSKAQHHQQQLRDQLSSNGLSSVVESTTPSPATKRRLNSSKNSPRMTSSRLKDRNKSPDNMTSSCYTAANNLESTSIMSQSLDPKMLSHSVTAKLSFLSATEESNEHKENCLDMTEATSPLKAATKLLPVPESLMSPDYRPSNSLANRIGLTQTVLPMQNKQVTRREQLGGSPKMSRVSHAVRPRSAVDVRSSPLRARKKIPAVPCPETQNTNVKNPQSSDDESEICTSKLQTIRNIANERSSKKNNIVNGNAAVNEVKSEIMAATIIQKMWRGYHTRNRNKKTLEILKTIQTHRTEEHIQKLALDMESTKAALESERKIQMLQMQAINALWKKVSSIPPQAKEKEKEMEINASPLESIEFVKSMIQTCNNLNAQVQELQNSMQDIKKYMSQFAQPPHASPQKEIGIATQTEISAVHTPQGEAGKTFPFIKTQRPSSLPLPISQRAKHTSTQSEAPNEVKQFAGSLVEGVIKTVSEISGDCEIEQSESTECTDAQTNDTMTNTEESQSEDSKC